MKMIFIFFIRCYQYTLSPFLGACCRFQPSCSNYAIACFEKLSWPKALLFTVKRLGKCHPWHPGGLDPI